MLRTTHPSHILEHRQRRGGPRPSPGRRGAGRAARNAPARPTTALRPLGQPPAAVTPPAGPATAVRPLGEPPEAVPTPAGRATAWRPLARPLTAVVPGLASSPAWQPGRPLGRRALRRRRRAAFRWRPGGRPGE